jgi:hypothetical protein
LSGQQKIGKQPGFIFLQKKASREIGLFRLWLRLCQLRLRFLFDLRNGGRTPAEPGPPYSAENNNPMPTWRPANHRTKDADVGSRTNRFFSLAIRIQPTGSRALGDPRPATELVASTARNTIPS